MAETYRSVAKEEKIEFSEKRSRFIGHVAPVQSPEEATAFLEKIIQEHPQATHNVWAYRLGIYGQQQRFSDAGEPSQTAGMPTLDVIIKQDITQLIIVTTRYFGGILLGAGGLVRAYSKAAAEVVLAAGIVTYALKEKYRLTIGYSEWGIFKNQCEKRNWLLEEIVYLEKVNLAVIIPAAAKDELTAMAQNITGGSVALEYLTSLYLPIN